MNTRADDDVRQPYAVKMQGICKSFGPVRALQDVALRLECGEIRALVGENGAGKTTLMNILYGMYKPDRGRIWVWGEEVGRDWSPGQAIARGIGMIHQHFSLIPAHTVLENVVMPRLTWGKVLPRWHEHRRALEELAAQYGFSLRLDSLVESLSVGEQQQVEILKLLYQGARLLILDEPTAVLTPQQIDALLQLLLVIKSQGYTVVLITHKLSEAMAVSDSITVLRGGRLVATLPREGTTAQEVAKLMVNRELVVSGTAATERPQQECVLEVRDLVVEHENGKRSVDGVSLTVRAGEIVGIAGVAGNGQSELAEALVGIRRATSGSILINGADVTDRSVRSRKRAGMGYICEDRHLNGMFPDMSVAHNLVMEHVDLPPFSSYGLLRHRRIQEAAREAIEAYDIRTPGPEVPMGNLSGGNQQKVVLARALATKPRILVACEPTRGLDLAATAYVRRKLAGCAAEGIGVLLISSELEELLELSHRILVMFRGRIVGEVRREDFDVERIGLLMTGQAPAEAGGGGDGDAVG